jgi:hypothetical protein
MTDDDLIRLIRRTDDLAGAIARRDLATKSSRRTGVFQVFNGGSMPTTTPAFFDSHPVRLSGTETEGGAGTVTADTTKALPLLVLGQVPAVGDNLPARLINGVWVAERRGSSGPGDCPGCTTVTYQSTYYANIPALGFVSLPLIRQSAALWQACSTASVLGFSVCAGNGRSCTPTTVTAAFLVQLICSLSTGSPPHLPVWLLALSWDYIGDPGSGSPNYPCLAGTAPTTFAGLYRAVDVACSGANLGTCLGATGIGSTGSRVIWTVSNPCTAPTTLTFSGAPVPDSTHNTSNFYAGTTATVKNVP